MWYVTVYIFNISTTLIFISYIVEGLGLHIVEAAWMPPGLVLLACLNLINPSMNTSPTLLVKASHRKR
jgi:hypothetical protein